MSAPPLDSDRAVDRVRADGLLAACRPVVVLYSGGRDSTCLLDLAVRVAGRDAVSALHVNYSLRDGADADERHCVELCARLGVALEVRRPRRPRDPGGPASTGASGSGNLQAWARDERYGAATRIALARDADVAAGHTATDQVETILYRLASSPSRRALLGMRSRQGLLVRPLLGFTREQTAAYCTGRGLAWREDETNEAGAFARNRIRTGLVRELLSIHPAAQDNVLALAELLRAEAEVLDGVVDEALGGRSELSLARLRELPSAVRGLVVQRLADEAAGGPVPGAARRAQDVAALSGAGTATLDLAADVRAVAEYGVLRFERRSVERRPTPEPVRLAIPGRTEFGDYRISCDLAAPAREPGVLDRSTLGSELLVRSWRHGDRMSPLGLGGSKSLQDLFTARRVPRRERASVAVVESAGEIAWVAGIATSDRFKVTDATREAVQLSVEPNGARP